MRAASIGWLLLLSGVIACGEDAETSAPDVSVHGTCSSTRNFTVAQRAGAGMADKTLALTFDDGPSEYSSELSEFLAKSAVAATFFINGVHVDGREDVLERERKDGHLIGNHSHTHPALTSLSRSEIVAEVTNTDLLLAKLVPADKLYFRPPFGDWDESVVDALSGSAMTKYHGPIGWDIGGELTATSAADWDCWDSSNGSRTVEECGDLYLTEIREKKRGVVLMHDGPPGANGGKTVAMMRYILPLLKADGYSFLRVDQVFNPSAASPTPAVAPGSPVTPSDPAAGQASAAGSCK
jgi:peptidoglycan/xylan/chitin deacetylase (PgdA/CDA1 family)